MFEDFFNFGVSYKVCVVFRSGSDGEGVERVGKGRRIWSFVFIFYGGFFFWFGGGFVREFWLLKIIRFFIMSIVVFRDSVF